MPADLPTPIQRIEVVNTVNIDWFTVDSTKSKIVVGYAELPSGKKAERQLTPTEYNTFMADVAGFYSEWVAKLNERYESGTHYVLNAEYDSLMVATGTINSDELAGLLTEVGAATGLDVYAETKQALYDILVNGAL